MLLTSMNAIRKRATTLFVPSSSSSPQRKCNVFLSFRGEDTRKSFTDHLYNALKLARVQVFIDNNDLPRGNEISPGLRKAIQEARVCIVIFSKNYASSKWCLDELVQIIEYKQKTGLVVLPVFYDVDPSFLRHQTVNYEDANELLHKWFGKCSFVDDQMKRKVEMWGAALHKAASISGYSLDKDANGHEARLIEKIVQDVLHIVDPKKKSKCPKIFGDFKPPLPSLSIQNNVHVTGIRVSTKKIVSNEIVKILAKKAAPHGILVEAATTIIAKVVIDTVSSLLKP